jgi:hypothetical protein
MTARPLAREAPRSCAQRVDPLFVKLAMNDPLASPAPIVVPSNAIDPRYPPARYTLPVASVDTAGQPPSAPRSNRRDQRKPPPVV